jgi:hypothetical protein
MKSQRAAVRGRMNHVSFGCAGPPGQTRESNREPADFNELQS